MTNSYADLEIEIERGAAEGAYQIDCRYSEPESDTTITPPGGPFPLIIDQEALLKREMDTAAYGRLLSAMLFAQEAVKMAYTRARSIVSAREGRLRLRLRIRDNAAGLHALHWETLSDPLDEQKTLLSDESLLFSRFIDSADWRRAALRPRQQLRALVVIANPANLDEYNLAAIDVAGETERAEKALGEAIPVTVLAGSGQATLANIFVELNKGYDILYLVAHGRLRKSEAVLYLEDEAGEVAAVKGNDLVGRFAGMWQRPRLVVLASCESAGTGRASGDAAVPFAALGPQLAREGIPAVLAMQGSIRMSTVEKFMPIFFAALHGQDGAETEQAHQAGQIDAAMAVARFHVQDEADWWMPVLYSRLKSGRISWYQVGVTDDTDFKWLTLINLLDKEEIESCTPILGSGLSEPLFGTYKQLAQSWAKEYGFPLAPHNRDDLPQVAQYLDVSQNRDFILDQFVNYLYNAICRRHCDFLSPELLVEDFQRLGHKKQLDTLNELITAVWEKYEDLNENDPYRALAQLSFPLFISTGVSDLLVNALRRVGKEPQMAICPWYDEAAYHTPPESFSVARPLVYQMFGHLSERQSLVLTEDDYFDYLIKVTRREDFFPDQIRAAITNQTTLIMGLDYNSWESRILFRVILNQGGSRRRKRKTHLSAQIAPTQPDVQEPDEARRYLEKYFRGSAVNIYWGKPEDFIADLREKLAGGI